MKFNREITNLLGVRSLRNMERSEMIGKLPTAGGCESGLFAPHPTDH
jgi:hypothetical protein